MCIIRYTITHAQAHDNNNNNIWSLWSAQLPIYHRNIQIFNSVLTCFELSMFTIRCSHFPYIHVLYVLLFVNQSYAPLCNPIHINFQPFYMYKCHEFVRRTSRLQYYIK